MSKKDADSFIWTGNEFAKKSVQINEWTMIENPR